MVFHSRSSLAAPWPRSFRSCGRSSSRFIGTYWRPASRCSTGTSAERSSSALGETRHWLASYYPVELNDEVIGIGLVVVDITDRQQAEDFRAVVMQNMAEGLVVADR